MKLGECVLSAFMDAGYSLLCILELMSVLIKGVISFHGFGIVDFRFSVNDFPSSANGDMIPLSRLWC